MAEELKEVLERLERLETAMDGVVGRVQGLEQRVYGVSAPAAQPGAAATEGAPPRPATVAPPPRPSMVFGSASAPRPPVGAPPSNPTAQPSAPTSAAAPSGDGWEVYVGKRLFLWLGAIFVFLGVAFFLRWTWQTLGSGGQLALGVVAGAAMLGGAEWARSRTTSGFSEGLAGGGLAILYLDAWAATAHYHFLPFNLALPLMVVVTVLGVALSLRQNSMNLIALSTVGGFLTPALVGGGGGRGGSPLPFLTYVTVLNAGILAVSLSRRWPRVAWLSFLATVFLVGGWSTGSYTPETRWPVFAFATVAFGMFAGCACFYSLIHREETRQEDLLLLFAASLAYFGAGYVLTQNALGRFPAAFPLGVALAFAGLAAYTRAVAPDNATLRHTGAGLAALFLTLAAPIQWRQYGLVLAWSAEFAVFLSLAAVLGGVVFRRAGQVVWLLTLVALQPVLFDSGPIGATPFLNERGLPLLAFVLANAWVVAWPARRATGDDDELRPGYAVAATVGAAWLLGQETAHGMAGHRFPWPASWEGAYAYPISMVVCAFALAAYAAGIRLGQQVVRFSALAVGVVAVLMPVVTSLGYEGMYRWRPFLNPHGVSFLVNGVLFGALLWLVHAEGENVDEAEKAMVPPLALGLLGVLLWGLTQETYYLFAHNADRLGLQWERWAQISISLLWTAAGTGLLVNGIARSHRPLRLAGLALISLTVIKVFVRDLGFREDQFRVPSFIGLGLALIGISFLYSRFGAGANGSGAAPEAPPAAPVPPA